MCNNYGNHPNVEQGRVNRRKTSFSTSNQYRNIDVTHKEQNSPQNEFRRSGQNKGSQQSELLMHIKPEAIHSLSGVWLPYCTTLVLIIIALTVIWQLYRRRGTQLREVIQERIIQKSENKPQSVLLCDKVAELFLIT
ncbi:unnamed protein product [Ceutorhynchus assimilis]|uniref:Uncharacterized protein n=1 Tax=Ceutorhynchus assimilis TaxID=467358 RepID=A0A9N9MMC2_9CUCU|nr:unnamed protein product [Ceutorhynchus assimilis]